MSYGGIYIENCPQLTSVAFPTLTFSLEITIDSNALLTSVSMPQLTSCEDLEMSHCPKLPNCVCTNLASKLMINGTCNNNNAMGVCN